MEVKQVVDTHVDNHDFAQPISGSIDDLIEFGFARSQIVIPGIAKLTDNLIHLTFKHMDGIIQNNQPLFILVWAGSIGSKV